MNSRALTRDLDKLAQVLAALGLARESTFRNTAVHLATPSPPWGLLQMKLSFSHRIMRSSSDCHLVASSQPAIGKVGIRASYEVQR